MWFNPIIIRIPPSNFFFTLIARIFDVEMLGLMIFPFIFINDEVTERNILLHETIHFQQCKETLVVGFYTIFILEFIFNILKYRGDLHTAYINIRFEREAYAYMNSCNYLEEREAFAWLKE
jgi:hypothetical protein